jgi:hypothetical protein
MITRDDFMLFIATMFLVGVGVFGKDLTNNLSGKDKKIKSFRILFVIFTISTLMLAFRDLFMKFNIFFYFFLCIAAGWANYSLPSVLDSASKVMSKWFNNKIDAIFNNDDDKYEELVDAMEEIKKQNELIMKNQNRSENNITTTKDDSNDQPKDNISDLE